MVSGCAGLAWVLWWALSYRANAATGAVDADDSPTVRPIRWMELVRLPNVQAFVFAKFMSDSAWYFSLERGILCWMAAIATGRVSRSK